jgi:hypothetical protein
METFRPRKGKDRICPQLCGVVFKAPTEIKIRNVL